MKIALYIEDGLEQIVLTPESDTEKAILGKLHDGSRQLSILKGSFFQCKGGWMRHGIHTIHSLYGHSEENDESTMIVMRPAQMATIECLLSPTGQHVFEPVTDGDMVTTGSYKGKCKYCGLVP